LTNLIKVLDLIVPPPVGISRSIFPIGEALSLLFNQVAFSARVFLT